jgi:hypothetical protein
VQARPESRVVSKNRNDSKPEPFGAFSALGSGTSQPIEHDSDSLVAVAHPSHSLRFVLVALAGWRRQGRALRHRSNRFAALEAILTCWNIGDVQYFCRFKRPARLAVVRKNNLRANQKTSSASVAP